MEFLETDFERAQYLQNLLLDEATGGSANNAEYQLLRKHFLGIPATKALLPAWVRTNRDLSQFWQFIKYKFGTYLERRNYIYSEFTPLLDSLENPSEAPSDQSVSDRLASFTSVGVQEMWTKALARRSDDPEGAITIAKALLESVCKHILEEKGIEYSNKEDLPSLYHKVSSQLNLSPSQHTDQAFKQILGGCSSVVNGLGTLRNRLGDAHGQGKKHVRPAPRHATLAVNLAGAMAVFLIETWENNTPST